jgi:hypothetical protein
LGRLVHGSGAAASAAIIYYRPLDADRTAGSSVSRQCSMSLDPRREECTIWTALAPDAVFTVRTYATSHSLETTT